MQGLGGSIFITHHAVAQKDAMNRTHRQPDSLLIEHPLELARSPIRVPQPHLPHLAFQLSCRPGGTAPRTPAPLCNTGHTLFSVTLQPQIACWAGYPKLTA